MGCMEVIQENGAESLRQLLIMRLCCCKELNTKTKQFIYDIIRLPLKLVIIACLKITVRILRKTVNM